MEIPESEELIIPEPQGISNLDEIPDDDEIEKTTPKMQILEMMQKDKKQGGEQRDEDDDMLPKVQELE